MISASGAIQITGRNGEDDQPVGTGSSVPSLRDQMLRQLAIGVAEDSQSRAREKAQADAELRARTEASARGSICVPDDLPGEWNNPPAGGKMETLQRQLKESLRERAKLQHYDETKWFTVDSGRYRSWDLRVFFQTFVTASDDGGCSSGHHEYLPLTP